MKEYKKPVKKTVTEKPICQYCLDNTQDKSDYYWVETESCYELSCLKCIEKHNLLASKPYFQSKRKQKIDKSGKTTKIKKKN